MVALYFLSNLYARITLPTVIRGGSSSRMEHSMTVSLSGGRSARTVRIDDKQRRKTTRDMIAVDEHSTVKNDGYSVRLLIHLAVVNNEDLLRKERQIELKNSSLRCTIIL